MRPPGHLHCSIQVVLGQQRAYELMDLGTAIQWQSTSSFRLNWWTHIGSNPPEITNVRLNETNLEILSNLNVSIHSSYRDSNCTPTLCSNIRSATNRPKFVCEWLTTDCTDSRVACKSYTLYSASWNRPSRTCSRPSGCSPKWWAFCSIERRATLSIILCTTRCHSNYDTMSQSRLSGSSAQWWTWVSDSPITGSRRKYPVWQFID